MNLREAADAVYNEIHKQTKNKNALIAENAWKHECAIVLSEHVILQMPRGPALEALRDLVRKLIEKESHPHAEKADALKTLDEAVDVVLSRF